VVMSLIKILYAEHVTDKKPHIRSIKEFRHPFDYGWIGFGGSPESQVRRTYTISQPITSFTTEMMDYFLKQDSAPWFVEMLERILRYNHDAIENMFLGSQVDLYSMIPGNAKVLHREFNNIRPPEHAFISMQHKIMEIILTPEDRVRILAEAIGFIDRLKAEIRDNQGMEAGKRIHLSNFWVQKYISVLLFNLPMLNRLETKVAVDGVQRSVSDALEDFDFKFLVRAHHMREFMQARRLPMPDERHIDAGHLADSLCESYENGHIEPGFVHCAVEQIVKAVKGKKRTTADEIELTGKDALFMKMILDSGPYCDLSHFWAGKYSEIMIVPPEHKGLGKEIHKVDTMLHRDLHLRLGKPAEPVRIGVSQLFELLWQTNRDCACTLPGLAARSKAFAFYVRRLPQTEMKEYILAKVETLLGITTSTSYLQAHLSEYAGAAARVR